MDTKRCPQCHKLLRSDAQICGLCGHNFAQVKYVRRRTRADGDANSMPSRPSNPPASPHNAGHYSGFHPEDQPYQSSFMVALRPAPITRRLLKQEPEEIVLPVPEEHSPATQASALPAAAPQRQARQQSVLPSNQAHSVLAPLKQDERSRKTGKLVATPLPLPAPMPQRNPSTPSPAPVPPRQSAVSPSTPLPPLQRQVPTPQDGSAAQWRGQGGASHRPYLTPPGPRTQIGQSRAVPILLIAASLLFLLATSVLAFLLLDGKSAGRQVPLASPALQLSATSIDLGSSGPGGTSRKTIALSNPGEEAVAWRASSDQAWLTLAPGSGILSGNMTTSLSVMANRGNLRPRTYTGHVTFTRQGNHAPVLTLTVTMGVTSAPVDLMVSLAGLSYYGSTAHNPASQVISVQNQGAQALDWRATTTTLNGTPWLSIQPGQGHLEVKASQQVTVSVQSAGLAAGSYQGTINFMGGANPQVTVTLSVVSPGNLFVSPSSLAFTALAGQQAANSTLVVQNTGGQSLNWTAKASTTNGGNWLSLTPTGGYLVANVAAVITVSTNAAALSTGSYQGTLTFSYGSGPALQVAIALTVNPPPLAGLSVQSTTLNFTTIRGNNPPAQSFLITDTGNAPLDWAIAEDATAKSYIPIPTAQGILAPGKNVPISVAPSVSQAGAGKIVALLTVYDSDKGTRVPSEQVTVTITILDQAQISLSVNSMVFNQTSEITNSTELLVITNTGSTVLNWALAQSTQPPVPWLSFDNPGGSLGPAAAALVNVTCDSSQLAPGTTYTATLVVSDTDPGSPVPPQTITITLTVSS